MLTVIGDLRCRANTLCVRRRHEFELALRMISKIQRVHKAQPLKSFVFPGLLKECVVAGIVENLAQQPFRQNVLDEPFIDGGRGFV